MPSESAAWRSVVAWLGDHLPDPLGSWLLRLADDSTEPWVDAEGRMRRGTTAVTRDEFERAYAERSGVTVEELRAWGRVVVRCWCGEPECEGWASVSADSASDYEPGGIYHRTLSKIGSDAEELAAEFELKASRARLPIVRRWYEIRAASAWKIARSEESAGAR